MPFWKSIGYTFKMEIETIMMLAFLAALILSLWKLYAFFPKKRLKDDDTTPESVNELTSIMIQCIVDGHDEHGKLTHEELFIRITTHEKFNSEHFWRFNPNRLNHLLNGYYLMNPHLKSISDLYHEEKKRDKDLLNPV